MEVRIGHGPSSGFLQPMGLHRRGGVFYQESSYSHLWFFGIMIAIALVIAVLPWDTEANIGGKVKYWLTGMCVWGAICGLAPYFVRNAFGQTIIIDPKEQTLRIKKRKTNQTVAWRDIIGLQVSEQKTPGNSKMDYYQLNLLWNDCGNVREHSLLRHTIRRCVVALGKRYESCFGFRFIPASAIENHTGHDACRPHPH
jgi:hypothetical protein